MKNKKLFVKYKIPEKFVRTVIQLFVVFFIFFSAIFTPKTYAADTVQVQDSLAVKILQVLFSANGNSNGSSSTNTNGTSVDGTIIPPTDSSDVAGWAELISSKLEPGQICDSWYCRMVSTISNGTYAAAYRQGFDPGLSRTGTYWCTRLVIDSVNLAGKKGFTTSESVIAMINFWASSRTLGYNYLPYDGSTITNKENYLKNLKPGCAFFHVSKVGTHTGFEHVAVVKTVQLNSSGNGFITTLDSNSSQKQSTFPVAGWQVKNTFYPHVSFGCFN